MSSDLFSTLAPLPDDARPDSGETPFRPLPEPTRSRGVDVDKHLCGCANCDLFKTLTFRIRMREALDKAIGGAWYSQQAWVDAAQMEQEARAAWLDHVLARPALSGALAAAREREAA